MLQLGARKQIGMDSWLGWLRAELVAQRERQRNDQTLRPRIQPEGAALHRSQLHHGA
jgi:hydrogenase nickel incorporation protein HypB